MDTINKKQEKSKAELFNNRVGIYLNWIAVAALLIMFILIVADILSSKFFNKPFVETVDMMSVLATVVIAFSLSVTIIAKRHIEVDFVVIRLPGVLRKACNFISSCFSMCFFCLIVWRSFVYALDLQAVGESTLTAHIPVAPFVYGIGIGCIPAVFIYAFTAYRDIKEVR
jgi:TRAP-type transport system small permease protein